MADPKLIAEARALLAEFTPLEFDCGRLCGHKCCKEFAPNTGVYLLPGEIELFDGSEDWLSWQLHRTDEYEFAPSWEHHRQVWFMRCHKLCHRERRPLECRTYPLAPFLREDGSLEMRYGPWAYGVCPLADAYALERLRPEFVEAARRAWEVLVRDPEMLDYVRWVSAEMRAEQKESSRCEK